MHALNAVSYSFDEVMGMFGLTQESLRMRILHYQAGMSTFAPTLHFRDGFVIALDPLYALSPEAMRAEVEKAKNQLRETMQSQPAQFTSKYDPNIWLEAHEGRQHIFIDDFQTGWTEQRYLAASLPKLPFENEAFDLALVSHHFFTDSERNVKDMLRDIAELRRVANEIRIYPLISETGALQYVGDMIAELLKENAIVELKQSHFELQKNANAYLRIANLTCSIAQHQKHQG